MTTFLSIVIASLTLALGSIGVFLLIARYESRSYFYIYATAVLFTLLAGASITGAILIGHPWSLPGVALALPLTLIALIFFAQGNDNFFIYKFRRQQERIQEIKSTKEESAKALEPALAIKEIEQGIDWPELEKWLDNQ